MDLHQSNRAFMVAPCEGFGYLKGDGFSPLLFCCCSSFNVHLAFAGLQWLWRTQPRAAFRLAGVRSNKLFMTMPAL